MKKGLRQKRLEFLKDTLDKYRKRRHAELVRFEDKEPRKEEIKAVANYIEGYYRHPDMERKEKLRKKLNKIPESKVDLNKQREVKPYNLRYRS